MSKIKIVRDSGYADRVRKYKVMCDGKHLGDIGNGESLEFETSPGEKEVFLKIDWCRSDKVRVNVPADGVVTLHGGSSLRGAKVFLAIVYAIFMPHKYLWLKASNN